MTSEANELRQAVQGYYDALDNGDMEAVLEFFGGDVLYQRPGYERFIGIDRLREYYNDSRKLGEGRHVVRAILVDGGRAAAHGTWEGQLKDGSRATQGFGAFFTFDTNNRIAEHTTYFFTPAV